MIKYFLIRQIKPSEGTMGYSIEPYDFVHNKNKVDMDWLSTKQNNGWTKHCDRFYTQFKLELFSE